jgi:hypothetical protein
MKITESFQILLLTIDKEYYLCYNTFIYKLSEWAISVLRRKCDLDDMISDKVFIV